jgi:hypothetical protein
MAPPKDYQKYQDQAQRDRAYEEGLGRLRLGTFVSLLGVLALGIIHFGGFSVADPAWIRYAILGTAPLGALIAVINYLRVPGTGKATGRAIRLLAGAFILGAATISWARYLKMF